MAFDEKLFISTVSNLRSGKTQLELSEELSCLVQACRDTGRQGKITFTLTIKPDKGDSGQYFLVDEIKCQKPKFERGQTLFWGTPDGNLQRTDPNQGEFEFKRVQDQPVSVKTITEAPTPIKSVN